MVIYPRYVNIFKPRRVKRKVSEATCLTSWPKEEDWVRSVAVPLGMMEDKESSLAARLRLF